MVFVSKCKKVLIVLRVLLRQRLMRRVMCKQRGDHNVNQDVVDRIILTKLKELESRRYLERRTMYQKCAWNSFDLDAHSGIFWGSPPHLSDAEFRKKYHMSRDNFSRLLDLIEKHPLFQ